MKKLFEKLGEKFRKRKKMLLEKRLRKRTKHYVLDEYLSKAGLAIRSSSLSRILFKACLLANLIITGYFIFFFAAKEGYSIPYIILLLLTLWSLGFILFLALIWLVFYLFLDLRIFKRKLDIEEVLPDFLFLTATNIRSGMTFDKALWFAVRPRFGVLAKEIEMVAKEVMSGTELVESLEKFANKYDSDILKRSIYLLSEGIRSGGEIGDLITRIAANIQESRLLRKEMVADVTAYVIFISFAAIVAAPVLLALSNQLILIIGDIISKIEVPSTGNMMFAITNISVTPTNFKIFAYSSLFVTSFFSSIIIATIRKGTIQEGIRYIPLFIGVSIALFIAASKILELVLSKVFI